MTCLLFVCFYQTSFKNLQKIRKRLHNSLKLLSLFAKMLNMKTLFDVQQLLKRFGIIVYLGKRLYDIEVMKLELSRLYEAGLVTRDDYMVAELILRQEHRMEMEKENGKKTIGD